jgi:DNA repair protein RadA/Sms
MAKSKTVYFCRQCGFESAKWLGRCPSCGEWNSFTEEVIRGNDKRSVQERNSENPRAILLSEIESGEEERIDTQIGEFNRVLGGGLVKGSLVLIGGEPGIGKSTLVLQMILSLNSSDILYVTGEESLRQVNLRAGRLGLEQGKCLFLCDNNLDNIIEQSQRNNTKVLIVDSVQTIQSPAIDSTPGSISQVRECTIALLKYAKTSNTTVLLIGHITKDGTLAGPKLLEHIVDVVIQFEGDQHYNYRILRALKNRFGSTAEIGIFEMTGKGLREVPNPSEILISQSDEKMSGVAIAATLEGIRPLLIEVQALVSTAAYGVPQRSATGFDFRRLNMLLAVLEKRAGFRLAAKDVFLNIAGGLRVDDPAIDLAVITSVLSSYFDVHVPKSICFAAELSLSGEIRTVSRVEQRIAEAQKLGFSHIVISSQYNNLTHVDGIKVVTLSRVDQLVKMLFGKSDKSN